MPLICIGPVCIPISALLPVLAYLARPVWKRLPEPTQQLLLGYWQAFSEWMQATVWDRIGWKAKPAPAPKSATKAGTAAGAVDLASIADGLRSQTGSVAGLHTPEDWAAAKLVSSCIPLIVDFTAEWCGPCQKIKPFFAELAAAHPEALFVKVDVDELEQVSEEASVRAMPTFQVRARCWDSPLPLCPFLQPAALHSASGICGYHTFPPLALPRRRRRCQVGLWSKPNGQRQPPLNLIRAGDARVRCQRPLRRLIARTGRTLVQAEHSCAGCGPTVPPCPAQVYRNGALVDTVTGARMEAIKAMVDKAVQA
jgi:thiol-disulfide isomerase/thioredoxin/NAD-dependent dihydropyrimidine dehydrogenase PreA subunit